MSEILLEVNELSVGVRKLEGMFPVVDHINLHIKKGEILGIVGESGCGKSLTALSIMGLLSEGVEITGGNIIFDGLNLTNLKKEEIRKIQGKDMTMIFQEPMTSLNPLIKIGKQVEENLTLHTALTKKEKREQTIEILKKAGLPKADELINFYPHQLSGGMRQRVMIAMAIICKPKLIIADEPTTALDVTIQAQILELLKHINEENGCAILFISHDLGVINRLCHRVAVMYAGSIIEEGNTRDIFLYPVHEYTKGLIGSIPSRDKRGERLTNILGNVPSIINVKMGCSFAPRCSKAISKCFSEKQKMFKINDNHYAYCYLAKTESEMDYVRN